jgi:hypothetical protein
MPASPGVNDPDHFRVLKVVTRLKPGALPDALQAELTVIARSTATTEPAQFVNMRRDLQVTATPLRERLFGNLRSILLILQAAVGMVRNSRDGMAFSGMLLIRFVLFKPDGVLANDEANLRRRPLVRIIGAQPSP